jgi:hypothetical protein
MEFADEGAGNSPSSNSSAGAPRHNTRSGGKAKKGNGAGAKKKAVAKTPVFGRAAPAAAKVKPPRKPAAKKTRQSDASSEL